MSEAKKTGYPSIDKPWNQFYKDGIEVKKDTPWRLYHTAGNIFDGTYPRETRYHTVYASNKDYPDDIALNYFNKKWTYRQLLEDIDKTAQALAAAGLQKGDVVIVTAVNMPEVVHLSYAASKMGIVLNFADPRSDAETLRHYITQVKAKMFVTMNLNYPLVKKAALGSGLHKIVVLSVGRSMPGIIRMVYNMQAKKEYPHLKGMKLDGSAMSYDDFMAAGEGQPVPEEVPYEDGVCTVMMHTGGTTGMPKTVLLSDESFAVIAWEYAYLGMPFERQQLFYNELPPFIIYGFSICIHAALVFGMQLILSPKFSPEDFPKQVKKYKMNHACGVPEHARQLATSDITKDMDLSFLMTFVSGGDAVNPDDEKMINDFLKSHGCRYRLIKGYGMTEVCATATTESHTIYRDESVGIPMPCTTVRITDPDDYSKELPCGEVGEVWLSTPRLMLGYLDDKEATDELIYTDENGTRWLHSGDLGYLDDDGFLFLSGRIRRIYITDNGGDGAKIFPSVPEAEIRNHAAVKDVCVAGRHKKDSTFYEVVAFVVKSDDRVSDDKLTEELKKICEDRVPSYMHPCDYVYIDALPLTPNNGKVDFRKLEDRAEEMLG